MNRCRLCLIPDTRPDTHFKDGICSACRSYANRPQIDWQERKAELMQLLDRHDGRCIVPSSGGKDSHYQVLTLIELGADVTAVTATTCHLTAIGRANIDNLARYAKTIEVTPNRTVRAKLNRLGLEMVGDISWPEHASIFSTPFRVAAQLSIPLIFYGECPQEAYGGPVGSEQAREMTLRWRSEFGGFLGLRPSDLAMMTSAKSMQDYEMPQFSAMECDPEAHFLGQYIEWDSGRNARVANEHGMQWALPTDANRWAHENQDNAQTGLHDFMCYLKYGYGRGCAQISVDVRAGRISRTDALDWLSRHDGLFPHTYAGVTIEEVLDRIGMKRRELDVIMDRFTNEELFSGKTDRCRPILKEFA
ncbi:MAG: N-acetyl sugar amidotransferase [Sulfuricaulis sp.]|nr:N-acetyl sugar amidotransferase [Sulfuricaulis sp.]